MIKLENIEVTNFMNAMRGIRNSWESWNKQDSYNDLSKINEINVQGFVLGEADRILTKKLIKAGADHAKFTRQIFISFDLTAPLYFWKQFDQYRVGVTSNSESTMHLIQKHPFTLDLFSFDGKSEIAKKYMLNHLNNLEDMRQYFLETKDKNIWRNIIQMLPDGFNQKRTITANYQVLQGMYNSRKNHKLKEWREFCEWVETLPYSELITKKF